MLYWGYWIGPLIAVVLALWLRPAYLVLLGLIAMAGFFVSYNTTESLYGHCETQCPPNRDIMVWVNGILFTITPALLVLGLSKHVLNTWRRQHRAAAADFSAKPSQPA
jgi:hypothetical protein